MPRGLSRSATVRIVVAAGLLVASSALADHEREVEVGYVGGGAQGIVTFEAGAQGASLGGVRIAVEAAERFVSVSLVDDSGLPVAAEVGQLVDELTGELRYVATVCGGTEDVLELPLREAPVVVTPVSGLCDGAVSAPTSGRVRVGLSATRQ